jgi:hypothetical protein
MLKSVDNSGMQEDASYPLYSKTNNKSLARILKSISDDKPLSIFLTIADTNSNGEISSKKLGLSRKQYYSRISAMV